MAQADNDHIIMEARNRLHRDGAESLAAMQRRVRALAEEWNLPAAEIAKLMYKRVATGDLIAFSKKHQVSIDWLLWGDLRGLLRMTRDHTAALAA